MVDMKSSMLEQQARMLAQSNYKADPDITRILWFPDPGNEEIRLVEIHSMLSGSDVLPVHFGPQTSPAGQIALTFRSAIALVSQEAVDQGVDLPSGWGDWGHAKPIERLDQ